MTKNSETSLHTSHFLVRKGIKEELCLFKSSLVLLFITYCNCNFIIYISYNFFHNSHRVVALFTEIILYNNVTLLKVLMSYRFTAFFKIRGLIYNDTYIFIIKVNQSFANLSFSNLIFIISCEFGETILH